MSKYIDDEFIDGVLGVLLVPLYFAPIPLILIGLSLLFGKEYASGILYLLGALIAYCLYQGIGKYFDLKKGIHRE